MKDFNVGILQLPTTGDKDKNLNTMEEFVLIAKKKGADVICLPEMWNCPYQNSYFKKFSEEDFGKTYKKMSEVAKNNKIYLIGGSIPIKSGGKIYNRSYVFDKDGREIYRYSKINLFDIENHLEYLKQNMELLDLQFALTLDFQNYFKPLEIMVQK